MKHGKWILSLAIVAMAAVGVIAEARAQEGPPTPGGPADDPRERPDQFRKQAESRMKESLGATDDEWTALQPKIEKVQALQRATRGGRGMMTGPGGPPAAGGGPGGPGGRGGPGGPRGDQPDANQRPQSEVEKKAESLQKTLENKDAKPDDVKAALTQLSGTPGRTMQTITDLLSRYGVTSATQLKAEAYAPLVAQARELVANPSLQP